MHFFLQVVILLEMRHHERREGNHPVEYELCRSNHFYAAYIYDKPEIHQADITSLLNEAHRMGYPVRAWWLSQAMDIQDYPDRLIVCVHHPASDENAGMDLYDSLQSRQVYYDELNAATMDEYICLGKPVHTAEKMVDRNGFHLFHDQET